MNIRLSLIVQQQAELFARWSENYFLQANDFKTARAIIAQLAPLVDEVHGGQTIPVAWRMADVDNFRNVDQDTFNFATVAATGSVSDSDYFNTAALVKAVSSTGRIVRYWIRSIWDGAVDKGGKLQRGSLWYKKFRIYADYLQGSAFKLRGRQANAKVPVTGIDLATGIVTAPGHPFQVGDLIHLYRVRGVKYLQKTWQVGSITTNTFNLAFYTPSLATGVLQINNPYAMKVSYVYESIATVDVVRATAHETSRPLNRLPGKRKTRR